MQQEKLSNHWSTAGFLKNLQHLASHPPTSPPPLPFVFDTSWYIDIHTMFTWFDRSLSTNQTRQRGKKHCRVLLQSRLKKFHRPPKASRSGRHRLWYGGPHLLLSVTGGQSDTKSLWTTRKRGNKKFQTKMDPFGIHIHTYPLSYMPICYS